MIALAPFTVRRIVRWSECDPAGVVYSGNFSEYLLAATSLFRRHLLDLGWDELRHGTGVDTPAKALALVFQGSLWPDDVFDMDLYVGEIRVRTIDFLARARRTDDGSGVFIGRLTTICVAATDRRIAADIPDALRTPCAQYRTINPPPPELIKARW